MAVAYLGLGSNEGRRPANLRRALRLLAKAGSVDGVSSLYETEPQGYVAQRWFLNAACRLETRLRPEALLALAKEIERQMGRRDTFRNGPRIVDVDTLLYDDLVLELPHLQIPHARMSERAFVLVPLADIAADVIHPVLKLTVGQLQTQIKGSAEVRPWKPGIRSDHGRMEGSH